MNHFLATYIDFVQSVGFIFLTTLAAFLTRKLFLVNKKDNYIDLAAYGAIAGEINERTTKEKK